MLTGKVGVVVRVAHQGDGSGHVQGSTHKGQPTSFLLILELRRQHVRADELESVDLGIFDTNSVSGQYIVKYNWFRSSGGSIT